MFHFCLSALLVLAAADEPASLAAGTQLNYRGTLEARGLATPAANRKSFELTLWITGTSDSGAVVAWAIEERGRGEFPWLQRVGRLQVDKCWRGGGDGPAVLYDRGEDRSAVPIPLPLLAAEQPLATGLKFSEGKLDYTVERTKKIGEQPSWQVSVRDAFGPKRMVWIDTRRPVVLAMEEKLTLGRGEEHQLKLELLTSEQLAGEPLAALAKALDSFAALGARLNVAPRSAETTWKSEQLATLREHLPAVAEAATGTPIEKIAVAAQRDLALQSDRTTALADLGTKFEGRAVEDFSVKGSGGEALARDGLDGMVTVLHFWDYRDEPLKEPYGQVGYLDFLYHRRKASGLQVYGVAVDGRLADERTRGAAERGVRKLKSFMNLSYPVLFDSGALIKQFGDPRLVGASLPLFVVVGADGKIAHYHVGHYDVHQDQGLKELDAAVAKALEKRGSGTADGGP